jgi:hypothetical protein
MGTATELSEEVIAAYNRSFEEYKAGSKDFPSLVHASILRRSFR